MSRRRLRRLFAPPIVGHGSAGPLTLVAALVGALAAACTCESGEPAVELVLRFEDARLRRQASSFTATLTVGSDVFFREVELPTRDRLEESQIIELPTVRDQGSAPVTFSVALRDGTDGRVLARGETGITASADACNVATILLGDAVVEDGGVAGMDGATADGGENGSQVLIATPARFVLSWVDQGTFPQLRVAVRGTNGVDLRQLALQVPIDAPFAAEITNRSADEATVTVTVQGDLGVGLHEGNLRMAVGSAGVVVPVGFRLFNPLHIGPTSMSCSRTENNELIEACDFSGEGAIMQATEQMRRYDHFILHAGDEPPAFYQGPIVMNELGWLSGAVDTPVRSAVVLLEDCELTDDTILPGVVHLAADGSRLEGFTVVGGQHCRAISTWTSTVPMNGTGGHEVIRMNIAALRPEIDGGNSIKSSLSLSENSTVAFSHIYGYWEEIGNLSQAHGSLIAHNTFGFYQESGKTPSDAIMGSTSSVDGVNGLRIINNVFIALPVAREPLIRGNELTRNFIMRGNVFSGFARTDVTDVGINIDSASGLGNEIDGAPDLQTPLLSPIKPIFLRGSRPTPFEGLRVSGRSLDEMVVDSGRLEDGTVALPGAFQSTSPAAEPTMRVRLGPSDCQMPADCTISADEDDELQVAAWSLWPGGTLEIAPGTYAGNAVVSWPISIVGDSTEEVVLRGGPEDELWRRTDHWAHRGVVVITREAHEQAGLRRVTIEPAPSASIDRGVVVEGPRIVETSLYTETGRPRVQNIIVRDNPTDDETLAAAVRVGTRGWVQDSLIQGRWRTCAELGSSTAQRLDAVFLNVTCRLSGPAPLNRRGAIDISGAQNAHFVNWVVEVEPPSDTVAVLHKRGGTSLVSFTAHSIHHRGADDDIVTGFALDANRHTLREAQAISASPFVGPFDSRLRVGAESIDEGVDPTTFNLIESLYMGGRGLGGTVRDNATIDRGAYEQAR